MTENQVRVPISLKVSPSIQLRLSSKKARWQVQLPLANCWPTNDTHHCFYEITATARTFFPTKKQLVFVEFRVCERFWKKFVAHQQLPAWVFEKRTGCMSVQQLECSHSTTNSKKGNKKGINDGVAGYRSPCLSHAKRALYHLSYNPLRQRKIRKLFIELKLFFSGLDSQKSVCLALFAWVWAWALKDCYWELRVSN